MASLDQLIASHERMDMPQPSPAGILILHCDNRLQHFESLAPGHQLAIVGILQQLEVDFDCLLLEEPICDGMLPLIRSAPLLVLSLTTDGTSLTDSFRALQSLYNKPLNQQSYVLVDSASSLPQAHGAFKRLQRAASRYLGTEPHYLGHMPPQDAQRPLQQTFDSMAQQPVSAFDQSLQAIAERFRRALAKTGRCNVLSTHFHQRHQSNAAIGVVPVQLAPQQTTDTPTTARADRTDPGQNDGYRAATRFAMRLGAARQNGEENPAEGR
ncbi:MAG: hypothetical protein KDI68_10975 [Gammaproteobacteria bacterium]|nr:hypothetical protein [Gammaproteobacteria bacterium]